MKKSNPFPYGKFCFVDFCGDQAKLDKKRTETGQHLDRKNARKRDSRTGLLSRRDCKKCRETFSLTPVHRMEGMETERSGAHGAKARYRRSDLRRRAYGEPALKWKNRTPRIGVLFLSFSGEEVTRAAPEGEIKGYSCTRFSLVQVVRPRRGYR